MTRDNYQYTYLDTDAPDRRIAVNEHTGEAFEMVLDWVPVGGYCVMPDRASADAERKAKKCADAKKYFDIIERNKSGSFSFMAAKQFEGVSPEAVARLVYLSSFLEFETGILKKRKGELVKRKDLPGIMRLSRQSIDRFLIECARYLSEDESGTLRMNKADFWYGKLPKRASKSYRKVYQDAVRRLYKATPQGKHKQLGYVFSMLPYINVQYNVLCNPEDIFSRDLERIRQMSCKEFCDLIGYDYSNWGRLKRAYRSIHFKCGTHEEPFCAFVEAGNNTRIYVNPHVLYSGTVQDQVEILGSFCRP